MSGTTNSTRGILNEKSLALIKQAQALLEKKSGLPFPETLVLELMLKSVTEKTLLQAAKKHVTDSLK